MTEELGSPRLRGSTRALGITGIALLSLTACGDGGEASPDQDEAGQEDVDPEEAEDQDSEPDEDADDATDDAAEEESEEDEEDSDAEAGEAPEIAEIQDELWASMEQAESVVLDAELPFSPEELEGQVDVGDAETIFQHYSGQVDGSALTFRESAGDAEAEYVTFDDATYLRGEDELRAVAEQFPGEIDEEELAEEFEGRWIEYTEVFPEGFSVADWLAEFREGLDSAGGFGDLEGSSETRDGEDVWVYTDDQREIVVQSGDEPVLLSVEAEVDGERTDVRFSDWDEAEEPDRPADEDILTVDDLEELLS